MIYIIILETFLPTKRGDNATKMQALLKLKEKKKTLVMSKDNKKTSFRKTDDRH